jgi:WD40 repeat protein
MADMRKQRGAILLMELKQALSIVQELLAPDYLNPAQEMVFKAAWDGKSYPEIAAAAGYDRNYIRGVGAQIWRMLATATEQRVSKNNFREIIELFAPKVAESSQRLSPQIDWGKVTILPRGYANDVSVFYGRDRERQQLTAWLIEDRCRLVAILGMGGMGKTTLAIKLAQELQVGNQAAVARSEHQFRCILWRSLLNAPLLGELLPELIRTLIDTLAIQPEMMTQWWLNRERFPDRAEVNAALIPASVTSQTELLVEILSQHRCAIVLDNCESIFQGGAQVGQYRQGYADYGELFGILGRVNHQSCLIITSREKPTEVGQMEGVTAKVRTLLLGGLDAAGGQQIFADRGCLPIAPDEWAEIDRYYGGNPLAFQLVAAAVKDIADGDVGEIIAHLRSAKSGFADIQILLAQQWKRLTSAEGQVMYWLAIQREPMTFSALEAALHPTWNRQDDFDRVSSSLLTVIQSLRRRCTICLLQRSANEILPGQGGQWSLQPVVMEYVTSIFVRQICTEIELQQPVLLDTHALIQADNREYIRQTQTRLIVEPIVERLRSSIGGALKIGAHLQQILTQWRETNALQPGYVAGNILNLLIHLKLDLTDLDCSDLVVRQAYLVGTELPGVNFGRSQMVDCALTQTFGSILAIAYSPDGKTLAASDSNGEIRIWRVMDHQFLLACSGHTNWVRAVKFSPDGRYLASSSDDLTLKLWDLQSGSCLRTFGEGIHSFGLSFSPDGRYLASGSSDGCIYYWDVLTGICAQQFAGHPDWSISVCFHPDGHQLVSGCANGEIRVWDLASGRGDLVSDLLGASQPHENWVTTVDYSPDGQTILSGSLDGTLRLWTSYGDVTGSTDRCRYLSPGDGSSIWSAVFSPDGNYLASAGADKVVRIWRTSDGQCVHRLEGHTQLVWSVAFHPDGERLVSGGEDRTIRHWRVSDGKCLHLLSGYTNWFHSIAWSPDGQRLITASCDAQIRQWDLHATNCLNRLVGHTKPTFAVAYDPLGATFASGSDDRTIRIWDGAELTCKQVLLGHTAGISALAYSPDGKYLVSGGIDRTIGIWDLHQGRRIQVRHGHTDHICALAYHPNGKSIASASEDSTVRIWDVDRPNSTQIITHHRNRVVAVAFDPLGAILASGGMAGSIVLWNLLTNEHCHTLAGQGGWVLSLAYSHDGRWLICGASDYKIYIWSMETGTCDKILTGHQGWVLSVSVSCGDRFIASASQDETIRVWDLATGDLISTRRAIRPYEGMNIAGLEGLTRSQLDELKTLGAKDK